MNNEVSKENIKTLCNSVKHIIKHHKELAKVKGETFNVFSVLNIESKEVLTHSRFIAELLNPKGSHLKGTAFLQHFIDVVHNTAVISTDKEQGANEFIVSKKVKVTVEKYLGTVNLKKGSGGSIDILLTDEKNNSISIENKIYATDQPLQMVRYYKHNTVKNTLYYLSLNVSKKPEEYSILHKKKDGNVLTHLIEDVHYTHITYKEQILTWLELCVIEAIDIPILRETIKQYILLIKKLTNTLDTEETNEVKALLFNNLEEAKYIADNYYSILYNAKKQFKNKVLTSIKGKLNEPDKYAISLGQDIKKAHSQIWINLKNIDSVQLKFGVESFSGSGGHFNGNMIVGIFDPQGKNRVLDDIKEPQRINDWWPHHKKLNYKNDVINLSNIETLKKLQNPDSENYKEFVDAIAQQTVDFIKKHEELVKKYVMSKNQ